MCCAIFSLLFARFKIKRWKSDLKVGNVPKQPRSNQAEGGEAIYVRGTAPDGSTVLLTISKIFEKQLAEITVYIKLPDETSYKLPRKYDVLTF